MEPCGQGVWRPVLAAQCRCTSLPRTLSTRAFYRVSPNTSSSLVRPRTEPNFECTPKRKRNAYSCLSVHGKTAQGPRTPDSPITVDEYIRFMNWFAAFPEGFGDQHRWVCRAQCCVERRLYLAPCVMSDAVVCMVDSCWLFTTACTDSMSPFPSRRGTYPSPPMLLQAPTRSAWGAAKRATSCWM